MTLPVLDHPPNAVAERLLGRDYLSPSAISCFQRCPLQFRFRYVDRLEPEFTSSALVFGSAIHAAIEAHCRALLEGECPDLDSLLEAYEERWQAEAVGEIRYGKGQAAAGLRSLAARMLAAFQASNLSKFDTSSLLGIEEQLRGRLGDSVPDLLGRVDLLLHKDDILTIVDFKTARSAWQEGQLWESSQQALLYAHLARPIADALNANTRFRWIVLTKTKNPVVSAIDFAPQPGQLVRVRRVVERVWDAIRQQHFYPAPSAMTCSSCPYQAACRSWSGHET